jgi:hypothetical protein
MYQNISKIGKAYRKQHTRYTMGNEIKELDSMKVHKHLGIEKNQKTEHKYEKEKLKEHVRTLRLILNTELSEKNIMQTILSLAIPVLRYRSGITNWGE